MTNRTKKGFTLIELLIVIVLIGILAGIVLTVLDPAQLQRRARETVLRTNVEKVLLALNSCASTTEDATNCNNFDKIGISGGTAAPSVANQPDTSTLYCLKNTAAADCTVAQYTASAPVAAGDTITVSGARLVSAGVYCTFYGAYNFTAKTNTNLTIFNTT